MIMKIKVMQIKNHTFSANKLLPKRSKEKLLHEAQIF